ncbi:DUF481 domain-containing protein [Desulfonema magnum]|uniref:DUF481 n=1 Tax=Desulfonema magnum TaxID=45655 RepID=A0A975GUB8_9BACT|nr:DUF481 domain-containing protein [Desulfonema magnum]QTA93867.1 DUF481 [Desulfonema magnum]
MKGIKLFIRVFVVFMVIAFNCHSVHSGRKADRTHHNKIYLSRLVVKDYRPREPILLAYNFIGQPTVQDSNDIRKWTNETELSFSDTGGNTDVVNLSANTIWKYKFNEKLEGSWKLSGLYGESDSEKNAENYSTKLRADYLFSKRFYSAITAGWLKDEFAGIKHRYQLGSPSVGYKFFSGPKQFLKSEASIDYVKEEYTDDTEADFPLARAFTEYEYAFTEKQKFSQSLEFRYDFESSDNYDGHSVTALTSALSDNLSLKASYEIKYDNEPVPSTLNKTDTSLGISLIIHSD